MPYLDGRGFNPITSYGKVTEGNFDYKNRLRGQWRQVTSFAKDKLIFGQTHRDLIVSQVREKTVKNYNIKVNNITQFKNQLPSKNEIDSFGKLSSSKRGFPNYPQSQFHIQSAQNQTKRGSLWFQYKKEGKI